jgi:patatin-like phospholipase/acyl hydrolase
MDEIAPLTAPARLLVLDGGGVKGIASLRILQSIIRQVQLQRDLDEEPRPVDYFDLAAGTSTGGIISVLLFRFRFTASEAIGVYRELAGNVFSPIFFGVPIHKWLGPFGYALGNPLLKAKALFLKS